MSNRLRNRDALRNNSSKCYAMFFEEEATAPDHGRGCRSRSSPKKRESPKKKSAPPTRTTSTATSDAESSPREESVEKHVRFVKSESSESEAESGGGKRKFFASQQDSSGTPPPTEVQAKKKLKTSSPSEKDQMFELFQPWALKTYGDQAKTKTITLRKKSRILKALDGKEQNNPDSSKFRFWVKSKGFTTRTPECFASGRQATAAVAARHEGAHQRDHVDLYVASTTKDFGERTYRKVAIVEEFFNIIYSVHVELGGRSGRHAGQKRTYRIITETYAFLPREAVTKFLSGCPACKKNLRPFSPSRFEEQFTESSSEFEALNYSSHNESSVDSTHLEALKPQKVKREESQLAKPNATELPKEVIKQETDIKSEPSLKPEDATSKMNEYWSKSNLIPSNLKGDDNILHYYHFLKKFCAYPSSVSWPNSESNPIPNRKNLLEARRALSSSPSIGRTSPFVQTFNTKGVSQESVRQPLKKDESVESSIDLRIKPVEKSSSSININIENSITSTSSNLAPSKPQTPSSDSGISVDVSINMSNNLNELKISCKTTPPKKRYSVYRLDSAEERQKAEQKCAINLSKEFSRIEPESGAKKDVIAIADTTTINSTNDPTRSQKVDLSKVKPITSTYLKMTRSMGLSDEDALKIDDLETLPTTGSEAIPDQAGDDSYAGLMKDADKLKLMLLAWNYQNSNAVRNGTDAPDLGVVGGLWAQYQNALALNTKQTSPVHRPEQSSPIENQDETNSSGQKDEDDGSEDDSDDKLDQNAQDPERLKAFNMFVRLFVDENLDRMIPISKQPKEKIQAIIDSCARQFPEFCERSRKRIRTYLKSCRRNKKAREGWDNTSRPTPAHLTSVQAEQILAIACENESMNAKRMRVGLDPISQAMPISSGAANPIETIAPSAPYPNFRTTPNTTGNSTAESDTTTPSTTAQTVSTARSSPLGLSTSGAAAGGEVKPQLSVASNITTNSQVSSPLYRPADFASPSSTTSPYTSRPQTYPPFFPNTSTSLATPTDLSMKQHSQQPSQGLPAAGSSPTSRPPIVTHKLSANEITAARQVITAYRESAAFLLRTADQVEQLLLQQQ